MPDLVTVSDVEICSTGSYKLGKDAINDGLEQTTFTEGDLADAILAVEDPHLHAPRLKLGHVNEQQEQSLPAFGVVENMRLSEDKQTLLADFSGSTFVDGKSYADGLA